MHLLWSTPAVQLRAGRAALLVSPAVKSLLWTFLWHSQKKDTDKRAERDSHPEGRSRGPWLVGSRRFSPSRRTPRRQQRRRKLRAPTRRLQRRPRWSTHVPFVGHRCPTPRPSSSILRANTPSLPCPPSWWTFRHEVLLTGPDRT